MQYESDFMERQTGLKMRVLNSSTQNLFDIPANFINKESYPMHEVTIVIAKD